VFVVCGWVLGGGEREEGARAGTSEFTIPPLTRFATYMPAGPLPTMHTERGAVVVDAAVLIK
jgi:hypothetical protein